MQNNQLQPGLKVQFRLGDIHLPEVAEVLNRMTEDTELQGSITLLSDAGEERAAFAVVEVKGVLMPIIVPASAIRVLGAEDGIRQAEKASQKMAAPPLRSGTQG